jgi:hypothetical protein
MTGTRCPYMLFALLLTCTEPLAKGGNFHSEDRYNPQHIDSLPPEIRKAVIQRCDAPKALHDFASYADNFQKVVLRFEHFLCGTRDTFCSPSGCLHQIYVSSSGGHYRLMRSYYAPAGD